MNIYSRDTNFNPTFYPYKPTTEKYKELIKKEEKDLRDISKITLQFGSNGVEVEELQQQLIDLNYLKGTPDGYFGKSTLQAVLNFQQDVHQVMDGIVGSDTWSLLEKAKEEPLPVSEPMIKEGDSNLFVTNLQLQLTSLGYYFGNPTGTFDNETVEAVKKFQNAKGLTVDGIVGPNTWRAVKKGYSDLERPIPILVTPMLEGTTGEEVGMLQSNLQKLGYYNGEINSKYDITTGNAVEKFQAENDILPTGIVNQITWESIEEKVTENRETRTNFNRQKNVLSRSTIRSNDTGEDVRDLQFYLRELGYYNGSIDGVFGSDTNKAVRAFQNSNNLVVDGIVGRNTWSALIHLYSPLAICDTGTSDRFVGVIIDPGHGGTDPGAVSGTTLEKDINLEISEYIANRFNELGIPYSMTRNSDETLTNTERIRRMKEPFGDIANAIVISNHINAGGGEGAEVIYPLRSNPDLARNILTELGNSGQKMRTYYQRTLPNDPTKDFYYIMRDTDRLQTLIIEYGFIDNPTDFIKLQNDWPRYAEAVVKAVAEYMEYPYTPITAEITSYVVRSGDTLYSIANRFGTTVANLRRLNNLTSDTLSVGQTLIIIEELEPIIPPVIPPIIPPSDNIYYTVKKGDTLWSIAKNYNTTIDEIKRLNNLVSNNLTIGQELLMASIISPDQEANTYIVKSGDTLYNIASRFGTTVTDLRRLNNLTTDRLSIGQILVISEGSVPVIPPDAIDYYIVRSGDTLYSIANRFGTTVANLRRLNNLTTDSLSIGQLLIVIEQLPSSNNIYIVKRGDTLWSIARQYGITVNELKRINNLVSDNLSIGFELLIKDENRSLIQDSLLYIVTSGNTLWTIAKHFNIKVDDIKKFNNLTNNKLTLNQEIKLPIN